MGRSLVFLLNAKTTGLSRPAIAPREWQWSGNGQ